METLRIENRLEKGDKTMALTYKEYIDNHYEMINKVPLHWAFSEKQLQEVLDKHNCPRDEFENRCRGFAGGFYFIEDEDKITEYLEYTTTTHSKLSEYMKDKDFFMEVILYEMANHEYHYNAQGNWDVLSCFMQEELKYNACDAEKPYFEQLGWNEEQQKWYAEAKAQFYKMVEEKGWW